MTVLVTVRVCGIVFVQVTVAVVVSVVVSVVVFVFIFVSVLVAVVVAVCVHVTVRVGQADSHSLRMRMQRGAVPHGHTSGHCFGVSPTTKHLNCPSCWISLAFGPYAEHPSTKHFGNEHDGRNSTLSAMQTPRKPGAHCILEAGLMETQYGGRLLSLLPEPTTSV